MEPALVERDGQVAERLHGDVDQARGPEGTESLEDVIFIVSKPTIQAGLIGTIAGIGDETGGRIAVSPQVFGQRREVRLAAASAIARRAHGASGR